MKVVSKIMWSIDSEIRCSVQGSGIILIIPFHLPHYLRIHLHNDLHIISRRLPPPQKCNQARDVVGPSIAVESEWRWWVSKSWQAVRHQLSWEWNEALYLM